MNFKAIFANKSTLDFLAMFSSNIIKKFIGFAKEVILASVFGSSLLYANFILIRTVSDLFSQLSNGNALQATLLSKFSKLYVNNEQISLNQVRDISKKIMILLFALSQLIQLPIIYYIDNSDYNMLFIFISLLLGVILCINFYSSVFLIVMQGQGKFKTYSIATTVDMFMSTIFLYPLTIYFSVVGILASRLIGFFSMIYKYLRPIYNISDGKEAKFKVKDFNISVMLLGNLANVIVIFSRFIAGLDNDNNITFFNYSVVLLNALLTAVILNINTLVLAKLSVKNDIKIILFSFFVALGLGILLVYLVDLYGEITIQFIFQRGAFTQQDTLSTFEYAKDLSISFVFIFIASALFQPFFSLAQNKIKKDANILAIIFSIFLVGLFVYFSLYTSSARENSLITIYVLSFLFMLMSLYSVYRFYKIKIVS